MKIKSIQKIQSNSKRYDLTTSSENFVANNILVHNSSSTFYNKVENIVDPNIFGVCSRNIDLKETEGNTYWNMAKKYSLQGVLKDKNLSLQGETHGAGIQKNKLGLKDIQLAAFDVFDIKEYRYFDYAEMVDFCDKNNIPRVPTIYVGAFKWKTVDELMEFADSQNYDNGTPCEGVVIRSVKEMKSEAMKGGRMAIKAISRRFLLTYGKE